MATNDPNSVACKHHAGQTSDCVCVSSVGNFVANPCRRGRLYAFLTRAAASFTRLPLCRARASQCEGVLAWERARREFQPRLPAAVFVDERELPVCLWGLRQSYSDGFLLAQIAHRQLSVLPGEMLICAARKALIVTFEMVDNHGVVEEKLSMAGTAGETDQGDQQRYRAALHRAAIRPCFSAPVFPPPMVKTRLTRPAATLRYRSPNVWTARAIGNHDQHRN